MLRYFYILVFSLYLSPNFCFSNLIDNSNSKNIVKKKDSIFILSHSRDTINNLFKYSIQGMDYLFSFGYGYSSDKTSYIDFKIGPLFEKYSDKFYNWDVNANIILPNTEKRFHLFMNNLETNSDNTSYSNSKDMQKKQTFILGLQFTKTFFSHFTPSVSLGAKFNSFYPDPFLRLSLKTKINPTENWKIESGDFLYYFYFYKLENKAYLNLTYTINGKTQIINYNNYRYREYFKLHEIKNGLGIYHVISRTMMLNYEMEVLRKKDKLFSLNISYYYIGSTFKHIFYSDWLYYELKPGLYFKTENDFNVSPRILLYFGIIFRSE